MCVISVPWKLKRFTKPPGDLSSSLVVPHGEHGESLGKIVPMLLGGV